MNSFSDRNLVEITNETTSDILHPQSVVFVGTNADGATFRIDIGRICYTSREDDSGNKLHRSKRYITGLVDKSTLSEERIGWLRIFLLNILGKGLRNETVRGKLYPLRYFFNYCDFEGSRPLTLEDLVANYKYYQIHLYQRSHLNNDKGVSASTLYHRLTVARDFIRIAFNLSNLEINKFIPKHRYTGYAKNDRQTSLKDLEKYLQACITYFNEFSDALLNNKYPIPISIPNSSNKNLYWDSVQPNGIKDLSGCFDSNGELLPFNQVRSSLSQYYDNVDTMKDYYRKTLINHRKNWKSNKLTSQKKYAYNLVSFLFFHIHIAFTASNVQPTLDLRISDLDIEKLGLSNFAKKHKYRSGRKFNFTSSTHLKKYLIKYIKVREWVGNFGLVSEFDDYLFLRIGENNKLIRFARNSAKTIINKSILFKNVKYITSRDIRNLCAEFYIKHSNGNLSLVANKLNNSVATVAKSYTSIDMETQSIEMNGYHEQLSSKLRSYNRVNEQPIPIKISTHVQADRIPAGSCSNSMHREPSKAVGFNHEAPTPTCATFESCLFCEYFSLHLDFEDIHKLLSLKTALQASSFIRNDPEHHLNVIQPSLDRIDEIIDLIQLENDNITHLVNDAKYQIGMNIYDKYWSEHIGFLLKASGLNEVEINYE